MAATFSVSYRDGASPGLRLLINDVKNAALAAVAGARGLANKLRDHFGELEATRPNKYGWQRLHFWAQVRKSVGNPVREGEKATVTIAHVAFRQKLEGGTIYPTGDREFLTIPATEEAYGKRAREFAALQFEMTPDPQTGRLRPALVAQRAVSTLLQLGKRGFKAAASNLGVLPLFWLVRSVKQAPTPGALPSDAELQQATVAGANEWARAVVARLQGGAA